MPNIRSSKGDLIRMCADAFSSSIRTAQGDRNSEDISALDKRVTTLEVKPKPRPFRHPLKTLLDDDSTDMQGLKAIFAMVLYFFVIVIVIGMIGAIVSSEIGYGNVNCAFADCKKVYVK